MLALPAFQTVAAASPRQAQTVERVISGREYAWLLEHGLHALALAGPTARTHYGGGVLARIAVCW
jgi:hypothetical protein